MEKSRINTPLLIISGVVLLGGGYALYYRSQHLSRNFHIKYLTRSATADAQGIEEQKKAPGDIVRKARYFAKKTLQPTRDFLASPIFINSWWRHPITNKAIGGVADSRHLQGEAVDMRTVIDGRFRNDLLAKAVLQSGVPFTKLILEEGTTSRPKWIHLSSTRGDDRQRILRKDSAGNYSVMTRQQVLNLV